MRRLKFARFTFVKKYTDIIIEDLVENKREERQKEKVYQE